MARSRVAFFAVALIGVLLGRPAGAHCGGTVITTKLVLGCAVGWDNQDNHATAESFNPWPATSLATGDGSEPLDLTRKVTLRDDSCPGGDVRLIMVSQPNHQALVRCTAAGGLAHAVWVSLDSLQCYDGNLLNQAPRVGMFVARHCPAPPDLPGVEATAEVAPLRRRALTDLQQARLNTINGTIGQIEDRSREDSNAILDHYFDDAAAVAGERPANAPPGASEGAVLQIAQRQAAWDRARERLRSELTASRVRLQALVTRLTRPRSAGGYGPGCDDPAHTEEVDAVHGQSTCSMLKLGLGLATRLASIQDDHELGNAIVHYHENVQVNEDFLKMRIALFYGLPDAVRQQMVDSHQLKLVRRATEVGGSPPVYDLHDGYVYGGHRNPANGQWAYDCSDFIASVVDSRAGALTTYELRDIALSLNGEGRMLTAREARYAACFQRVALRAGDEPEPLDLVVSRNDTVAQGHVVLVDDYNPATGEITDYEAHGAPARRVGRFKRPLFEESSCAQPLDGGIPRPPAIRPDIFVLRLKTGNVPGCPLNLNGS